MRWRVRYFILLLVSLWFDWVSLLLTTIVVSTILSGVLLIFVFSIEHSSFGCCLLSTSVILCRIIVKFLLCMKDAKFLLYQRKKCLLMGPKHLSLSFLFPKTVINSHFHYQLPGVQDFLQPFWTEVIVLESKLFNVLTVENWLPDRLVGQSFVYREIFLWYADWSCQISRTWRFIWNHPWKEQGSKKNWRTWFFEARTCFFRQRKIFHPIRGNVKERKLENIKPEGTYSKWDSDFVYAVYTTPFQGRPSNGYHLQELWKVRSWPSLSVGNVLILLRHCQAANYLDIKDLCALVCAQFAVHLASRGAREGQKLGVLGSASGQSFDAVEKSLIARGTPLQDQAWNQDEAGNWHHSPIFNEDGTPKIKHLKDVTEAYAAHLLLFFDGSIVSGVRFREYAILKEANKWAWELRKSSVEEKSEWKRERECVTKGLFDLYGNAWNSESDVWGCDSPRACLTSLTE